MKSAYRFTHMAVALGVFAGVIPAGAALAQVAQQQDHATPKGWNYEIRNGQRVPKANRITNPDGSWREETRQGACVTTKEKTADGAYKESRKCN